MLITRDSLATTPGPADWFTGKVYLDTIATPAPPSRVAAAASTSPPRPGLRGTRTRSARRST